MVEQQADPLGVQGRVPTVDEEPGAFVLHQRPEASDGGGHGRRGARRRLQG